MAKEFVVVVPSRCDEVLSEGGLAGEAGRVIPGVDLTVLGGMSSRGVRDLSPR